MRLIDKMCIKMVEKVKFSIFLGFFYLYFLILCGFYLVFKLVKKKVIFVEFLLKWNYNFFISYFIDKKLFIWEFWVDSFLFIFMNNYNNYEFYYCDSCWY